jgi:hypothetical protein
MVASGRVSKGSLSLAPAAPARPPPAAARGAGRSARARPAATPRGGARRASRAASRADASACRPGNRSPLPDTSRGERRRRKGRRPTAVRPPDDRRSLAAALAEQGPGPGNPTARMCGWRACLEAGGVRIPARDAACSRFQTVPTVALLAANEAELVRIDRVLGGVQVTIECAEAGCRRWLILGSNPTRRSGGCCYHTATAPREGASIHEPNTRNWTVVFSAR